MLSLDKCVFIAEKQIKPPGRFLTACLEFPEFYIFNYLPREHFVGTTFPVVSKKDGNISTYDISTNPEAFYNAKDVTTKAKLYVKR